MILLLRKEYSAKRKKRKKKKSMMGDTHPNEISPFQLVHMILLRFVGFTYNSTLINFKSNP